MEHVKKGGPSIDPCGTPYFISLYELRILLISTLFLLSN